MILKSWGIVEKKVLGETSNDECLNSSINHILKDSPYVYQIDFSVQMEEKCKVKEQEVLQMTLIWCWIYNGIPLTPHFMAWLKFSSRLDWESLV